MGPHSGELPGLRHHRGGGSARPPRGTRLRGAPRGAPTGVEATKSFARPHGWCRRSPCSARSSHPVDPAVAQVPGTGSRSSCSLRPRSPAVYSADAPRRGGGVQDLGPGDADDTLR
ncbi:hypothetical protein QJS66_09605 [Kocuria rhizophila]|nr:hypothetical protein QJS66_09605 [Kocuria rhizophila]